MFWKKPTTEAVIDAVARSFTKEELEKMGLTNSYHDEFKKLLSDLCGNKKPKFSVRQSTNILVNSKFILCSMFDAQGLTGAFWARYCYENLFE